MHWRSWTAWHKDAYLCWVTCFPSAQIALCNPTRIHSQAKPACSTMQHQLQRNSTVHACQFSTARRVTGSSASAAWTPRELRRSQQEPCHCTATCGSATPGPAALARERRSCPATTFPHRLKKQVHKQTRQCLKVSVVAAAALDREHRAERLLRHVDAADRLHALLALRLHSLRTRSIPC
jgi:hypothetical protein